MILIAVGGDIGVGVASNVGQIRTEITGLVVDKAFNIDEPDPLIDTAVLVCLVGVGRKEFGKALRVGIVDIIRVNHGYINDRAVICGRTGQNSLDSGALRCAVGLERLPMMRFMPIFGNMGVVLG